MQPKMKLVRFPFAPVAGPKKMLLMGNTIVVASETDGTLVFLDKVTMARTNAMDLGHNPQPTCVARYGTQIFVGCWKAQTLAVIGPNAEDGDTLGVLRTLRMRTGITGIATGNDTLIASMYGGGVMLIELKSRDWTGGADERDWTKAMTLVETGPESWAPVLDEGGTLVYVPQGAGRVVSAINVADRKLERNLTVPSYPNALFHGALVNPSNGIAYVVFSASGSEKASHIAAFDEHGVFQGVWNFKWDYAGRGQTFMVDDDLVLVCSASREVVRINANGEQVDTLPISQGEPYGLVPDEDGSGFIIGIKEADIVCRVALVEEEPTIERRVK